MYSRGSTTLVPKDRYTSTEFAELEHARLWPRVWQIACTVDHVAEPGDWFEHRTGRYSVVVVRGDDGELRAFQNVCRHRGNAVLCGSGSGLTELRCPFHRWTWGLDGSLREVPSRAFFGRLDDDSLGLFGARAGVWGRLVFVSLDIDAPTLDEYLEGVPADSAWARLDEFRCTATTRTTVACNWKVVSDGFSETYHVQGIHPEMLGSIDDVNAPQRIWDLHSVSYQEYGVPSPRLGRHVSEQQVWDSFVVTQGGRMGPQFVEPGPMPEIPAGQGVRDVIADLLRAEHRRTFGVDLSWLDTAKMMHLSQYNLFPNATVLVWGEMVNVLLGRPGPTPDSAELVTFLLHRAASADAPRTRPADIDVPNGDDLGLVLGADVGVLESMQRGLHQPGLTHLVVSGEECRILNLHRNLARLVDPAHAAL